MLKVSSVKNVEREMVKAEESPRGRAVSDGKLDKIS